MKNTINKFYEKPSFKQPHKLECKFLEYNDTFDIDLIGNDQKPDCCINHFGYNFYFRTNSGIKRKKYKSIGYLFGAVKRTAKGHDLTLQSIGLKVGYKYRPIIKS